MSLPPWAYRIWLPILSSLLTLAVGEGICRLFGLADELGADFHFYVRNVDGDVEETYNQEDAQLMWSPRPGYEDGLYRIDSNGFRGTEMARTRDGVAARIAFLGDSTTFGIDVAEADTFVHRLGGQGVETVNAGVTGYTSAQVLQRYRASVRRFRPEIVVCSIGVNDPVARFWLSDAEILNDAIPDAVKAFQNSVLLRSHFYRVIRKGVLALLKRDPAPRPAVPRVSDDAFRDNLRTLAQEVRDDGGRLILVAPPINPAEAPGWPRLPAVLRLRAGMEQVARETGATYVFAPRLSESGRSEGLFIDIVHPNAAGHAVLAEAIRRAIAASGFPPPVLQ